MNMAVSSKINNEIEIIDMLYSLDETKLSEANHNAIPSYYSMEKHRLLKNR